MPAKLAGYFKRDKEARAKLHVSGQNSLAAAAALIFFCLLFFYQDKKRPSSEGGEVWPGTSRIVEGPESLKLLDSKYVPSQIWLASLTP